MIVYYKDEHKYALQRIDGDRRTWNHLGKHILKVVIDSKGTVVGFLAVRLREGNLELVKLVVDLGYRGIGYGTELHNELLRMARNNEKPIISTEIDDRNDLGINFLAGRGWLAMGFVKGRTDRYYFTREVIL